MEEAANDLTESKKKVLECEDGIAVFIISAPEDDTGNAYQNLDVVLLNRLSCSRYYL